MFFLFFLFGWIVIKKVEPIMAADARVENMFYSFREPWLTAIFVWITLLAKWQVALVFAAILSLILWLWKKRELVFSLWIIVVGGGLSGYISKLAFSRRRPGAALYIEDTFSFPSAHSIIAAAFFGFIIYVFIREARKRERKIIALFGGLALVLLIGISRLYLGAHFLSDVFGGYILGLFWLTIGIVVAEQLNTRQKTETTAASSRRIKIISGALVLLGMVFYIIFALIYKPLSSLQFLETVALY